MTLKEQLEELHAAVVETVTKRVKCVDEAGDPLLDDDGNPVQASGDDLRIAMTLLKQNSITADLSDETVDKLRSRMAGKLDFSTLRDKKDKKVVPLRGGGVSA